ncbi:MAG: hypothetical protein JOY71_07535 [Acetobacteraceae bacterium]|nr:hypothetical protein [Acetobacteraceae bacterium]
MALVVLALLVIGLGQGTRFGLLAWNTGSRISESREGMDAVDRTLRHLIANIDPGNETQHARFSAAHDRLVFFSTLPELPGIPTRQVEAALIVDGYHRLVLRWRPYLHAEYLRAPPPFTETELLRGVDRMELAFWGPSGWASAWAEPELPRLIRVRLTLSPSARRRWPDIIAAPELDRP